LYKELIIPSLPDTSPLLISGAKKRGLKAEAPGEDTAICQLCSQTAVSPFPTALPSQCVSAQTWENDPREQAILRLLGHGFSAVITPEASN